MITVGASEGVRASGTDGCGVRNAGADSARDIIDFSSRGPTDDGRLKPDLVAPGTHITGARPRHAGYTGTGTCTSSFAGGFYSLDLRHARRRRRRCRARRRWCATGTSARRRADPSPALTKALLVNTATDLAGGDNGKGAVIAGGPNTDQGWGRVEPRARPSTPRAREFRDQLADVLGRLRARAC